MVPLSIASECTTDPIVFGLDAEFHISDVKIVGTAAPQKTPSNLKNIPFLSLIPPEARGAADDFFSRLLIEQVCSTNQLFLKFPNNKSVPVDLLCRKVASRGRRIWEVVVWNRERYSRTERELMLLYAISSRINQAEDEFTFSEEVLFQIHNMMDVDASTLLHLNHGRLEVTASRGLSAVSQGRLKNLPAWQVDLYLPVDSVDPPSTLPEGVTREIEQICEFSSCGPWLIVPVRTPIQFYGILGVSRKSNDRFTERERYLLMSLGRNLASASEKGRLFRRIKERNRNLTSSRRELRGSLGHLEKAHRELKHLEEMKKSFVTLASHELQTPLTSIIGNAELMKKDYASLPERTRESLDELLGGVDDLRARVDALLAASLMDSGLFVPRINPCTTRQIFADLQSEVSRLDVNRQLLIRQTEEGEGSDLLLDRKLVKQALWHQVENALRHTPDGGEISLACVVRTALELQGKRDILRIFYPDIEERLDRYAEYVLVTVEDTGDGVADIEKTKIFTPFYGSEINRHHSSRGLSNTGKGFGLGLSMARRIIEAHQGMLWCEDRPGGGSRFCQLLPQTI